MPGPAITSLADVTLSSATTTINLTGFSSSYKDLIIAITWQNSGNASAIRVRFNDSTASYDWAHIYGNMNSNAGGGNADENSSRAFGVAAGPTTQWQTGLIKVYDYANSSRNKYMITRHADAAGDVSYVGTRWESTSAITKVTIFDVLGQTIQAGARIQVWGRI